MSKLFLLIVTVLLLQACAIAPGMRMTTTTEQQHEQGESTLNLQPISASLIAESLQSEKATLTTPEPVNDVPPYRIQPQDILQITIWEHPELTIPSGQFRQAASAGNLVRDDGSIFYPYAGIVPVAGKTFEEVRQLLTKRLSGFIVNPQVDVKIAAYRSQRFYVTGFVAKPGVFFLTDIPSRILDAINLAGGMSPEADWHHLTLSRNGKINLIDAYDLLHHGDMAQNILLQEGDVLNVPSNVLNRVFVLGEVSKQGTLPYPNEGMTLADAISDVGGYNLDTADPANVFVIRSQRTEDKTLLPSEYLHQPAELKVFHLNSKSPDALLLADQFHLHNRDIVYVSTKGIARWSRVLNKLGTTINAIAVSRALLR